MRCDNGDLYVLVAPPTRELEPDDDPDAYVAGGFEPALASPDARRLLHGYAQPAAAPAPRVEDETPDGVVDPWIPVTEVDL